VKVTLWKTATREQNRGMEDNETLLTELNKKKAWFHAKKIGPVFALQVSEDREIQTLEGKEVARAGDMLCRGIAGELWPQTVRSSLHMCNAISCLSCLSIKGGTPFVQIQTNKYFGWRMEKIYSSR